MYFSKVSYDMDNMSRLYNCTVARVGYIIALPLFNPLELEIHYNLIITTTIIHYLHVCDPHPEGVPGVVLGAPRPL